MDNHCKKNSIYTGLEGTGGVGKMKKGEMVDDIWIINVKN